MISFQPITSSQSNCMTSSQPIITMTIKTQAHVTSVLEKVLKIVLGFSQCQPVGLTSRSLSSVLCRNVCFAFPVNEKLIGHVLASRLNTNHPEREINSILPLSLGNIAIERRKRVTFTAPFYSFYLSWRTFVITRIMIFTFLSFDGAETAENFHNLKRDGENEELARFCKWWQKLINGTLLHLQYKLTWQQKMGVPTTFYDRTHEGKDKQFSSFPTRWKSWREWWPFALAPRQKPILVFRAQ